MNDIAAAIQAPHVNRQADSEYPVVIRLICWANGEPLACAGQFIRTVDVQIAGKSEDWLTTTPDIAEARKFTYREALDTWREIYRPKPIRPDGKPNRPLTAFTIEIARIQ